MTSPSFLARPAQDGRPAQPLRNHLLSVAALAERFAAPLGLQAEARYSGLLHDLGKYRPAFQDYLAGEHAGDADTWHAADGARHASNDAALPSAFAIAGHHAGLHDLADLQERVTTKDAAQTAVIVRRHAAEVGPAKYAPGTLLADLHCTTEDKLVGEFATRMLFSTLVDADRLDAGYWPEQPPAERKLDAPQMLDDLKRAIVARRKSDSPLQAARDAVFDSCLAAGSNPQGFFALTVPTGGGKTLSSMAFALEHARTHGLRRIIVVIPYLSIIEQNAADYARVFGPDAVLECHSAVDSAAKNEVSTQDLWTENWDAPLIVTTSVQFLESLLAASPGRCRKLHRVAQSVVVFDEVQTMPSHLLRPCLSVFRELVAHYSTTFLFCTATPPAFRASSNLVEGFASGELKSVLADEAGLFRSLRRVRYHLPQADETTNWPNLAGRLVASRQTLCVVNTTRHARELWAELRRCVNESHSVHKPFHLSAGMCAQHRFDKLSDIRLLLRLGAPCRVVSTQLVEAGVDIDFPEVWRAFGPLDSIVQAAGRCNRENRLAEGHVHVFRPEDASLPRGVYSSATDQAAIELARLAGTIDPGEVLATDPNLFARYFNSLHGVLDVGADIQDLRAKLKFRSVAEEAKVIKDDGQPVVVPYRMASQLLDALRDKVFRHVPPCEIRAGYQSLQRYMVNLRRRDYLRFLQAKYLAPAWDGSPLLALKDGFYDDDLGIVVEDRPPEDLIV